MEIHEKFRNAILMLRNRDGIKITQQEIAEEADLTLRYYQKLETGESKKPSLEVVDRIAHAFGMNLSDFCKFMEELD